MGVDAKWVRHLGRDPVLKGEYEGWTLTVYRVGRYHEYQGLADHPDHATLQTRRIGGADARRRALDAARILAENRILRDFD